MNKLVLLLVVAILFVEFAPAMAQTNFYTTPGRLEVTYMPYTWADTITIFERLAALEKKAKKQGYQLKNLQSWKVNQIQFDSLILRKYVKLVDAMGYHMDTTDARLVDIYRRYYVLDSTNTSQHAIYDTVLKTYGINIGWLERNAKIKRRPEPIPNSNLTQFGITTNQASPQQYQPPLPNYNSNYDYGRNRRFRCDYTFWGWSWRVGAVLVGTDIILSLINHPHAGVVQAIQDGPAPNPGQN